MLNIRVIEMQDIDIIKQLMNGNHLERPELNRALTLIEMLKINIQNRMVIEK